jgi:riboflavin synthase
MFTGIVTHRGRVERVEPRADGSARLVLAPEAPARVNLERALRVGDELGGHWVQGHVDGVGQVVGVERRGADVRLSVVLPEDLAHAVVPKGSVTLDGVSLTVGEVWEEGAREAFSVYLIPHTLAVTGLSERGVGARVNVESDPLGRWVRRALDAQRSPHV